MVDTTSCLPKFFLPFFQNNWMVAGHVVAQPETTFPSLPCGEVNNMTSRMVKASNTCYMQGECLSCSASSMMERARVPDCVAQRHLPTWTAYLESAKREGDQLLSFMYLCSYKGISVTAALPLATYPLGSIFPSSYIHML